MEEENALYRSNQSKHESESQNSQRTEYQTKLMARHSATNSLLVTTQVTQSRFLPLETSLECQHSTISQSPSQKLDIWSHMAACLIISSDSLMPH